MRIKDLPAATTLGSDFYIATDDATAGTRKATFSQMISMQTAATGSSSTDYLLVYDSDTGDVVKMSKSLFLTSVNNSITNLEKHECIRVTTPSFSSLSKTYNATGVTADMVVLGYSLSNPAAQTGPWTITTAANQITIAGSISGSTTLTLTLAKPSADVVATT